ncbi:hypothetical protein BDP27DRAFT_1317477 [Rhodocollybia butyracea]|uniref:Uncharacterized protein n=1 Tax=Rhodocollybia butyracea TaxID=206335 RepID=A0A9P5PX65_9AGAR|nr:hypothetical protein BDP27DRAFT_1317477 [Rhodocollybia butyracea]
MGRMAKKCAASESCSLPVDVILQSSDSGPIARTSKCTVMLFLSQDPQFHQMEMSSSSLKIIQLMLCFTHNMPPPDLSLLDIQTLFALGETVNLKYSMHYASECVSKEINKRAATHTKPLEILVYKIKVSDLSMIDEIARRTMDIPMENAVNLLVDLETFRIWVRYRDKWQSMLAQYREALTDYSQSHSNVTPITLLVKVIPTGEIIFPTLFCK